MNKISSSILPNSTGAKVADLQIALIALGYIIAPSEVEAQKFGISTTDAIKDFQISAFL
jgi:peptidoglycan hydrolase-like protein with peptidoglycan-binding domain